MLFNHSYLNCYQWHSQGMLMVSAFKDGMSLKKVLMSLVRNFYLFLPLLSFLFLGYDTSAQAPLSCPLLWITHQSRTRTLLWTDTQTNALWGVAQCSTFAHFLGSVSSLPGYYADAALAQFRFTLNKPKSKSKRRIFTLTNFEGDL